MDYKRIFGLDFKCSKINVKGLPVNIIAGRSFFKMSYLENEFILVKLGVNEKFGAVALKKQCAQISEKNGVPVAFEFNHISKIQRDSLIKKNIPFIVDTGHVYLPFLGVMLSDIFYDENVFVMDKMMPVTQLLFLYMLYNCKDKTIMKKDAAEKIGVTRTSLTRASKQLLAMRLIEQEKKGKEYYIHTIGMGMELYMKAKPFLINPIQRKLVIENNTDDYAYAFSGESALARKTMLNEPLIPVYGIYKADVDISTVHEVDVRWETDVNAICLELWKYNPLLLSFDGNVDPVSLSLCFEDNVDERIEGAIEEYMEAYKW